MRRFIALLVVVGLAACSDGRVSAPQQQTLTSSLSFIEFEPSAFATAQKSGSFWAVQGQTRTLSLRYADTGAEFLRFEVGANSLSNPDSVLITVTVDANGRMSYNFQPSGLQFNADSPARLTLDFSRGSVLALPVIYRRDAAQLPWLPTDHAKRLADERCAQLL